MKVLALAPALSVLFLCQPTARAAEVGILVGAEGGGSATIGSWKNQTPPGIGISSANLDSVKPTAFGIRAGLTILDLTFAELGLFGTYQPNASKDLNGTWSTGAVGWTPSPQIQKFAGSPGKVSTGYVALGAQLDWKMLMNFHLALEARQETVKTEFNSNWPLFGSNASFTRPWVSAGIGYTFPVPEVTPFVRLEAGIPLKTYNSTVGTTGTASLDYDPGQIGKALAPKYQVALYGGIRF